MRCGKKRSVFFSCFVCSLPTCLQKNLHSLLTMFFSWKLHQIHKFRHQEVHVIYVRSFADSKTDKRYSNLWVVETNGTNHRPLTFGNYSDSNQQDGRRMVLRIAFISNRDGSGQIYLLWPQTGQIAKITNLISDPSQISWSPDGKWLAYIALVNREKNLH